MTSTGAQRRALVLLGCLLAVGGCTSAEEPTPGSTSSTVAPSPDPTDEPTEAPVVEPPEKPDAMANDDEAGARAAADYFLALYSYTLRSGDAAPLEAFCDADSTFCSSLTEEVRAQEAAGERYSGGGVSWIDEPRVVPSDDASRFEVSGVARQDAFAVVGPDGASVVNEDTDELTLVVLVYVENGEWRGYDVLVAE